MYFHAFPIEHLVCIFGWCFLWWAVTSKGWQSLGNDEQMSNCLGLSSSQICVLLPTIWSHRKISGHQHWLSSIASSSVFKRDKGWPYTGPHTLKYEMLDGFFGWNNWKNSNSLALFRNCILRVFAPDVHPRLSSEMCSINWKLPKPKFLVFSRVNQPNHCYQ